MAEAFGEDAMHLLFVFADRREFRLAEVPEATGLDATATAHAIDELVESGIVVADGSRFTIRFTSRAAVRGLVRQRQLGVDSTADAGLIAARAALDGVLVPDTGQRNPRVVKISDRDTLMRHLTQIAELTRTDLISLHAGAPPSPATLETSLVADRELIERGVTLRIVFPIAVLGEQRMHDYAQRMEELGAQLRFADALPHRLIVSDAARAVVPIDRADTAKGALITSEPVLVSSLRHLAGSLFRRGRSLADIDVRSIESGPTEMELRMISMMSSGVTDEVAARRLAVSERTFRRHMSSLLDRLNATSRFQAGIRAVERGWI